jgi:hypothetical protein
MVSHQFFYQLALLAIIWLFVLLHLTGSKPGLTTPPVAAKPKRKRSTEPKAFQGLTHKPHCVLCERETVQQNLGNLRRNRYLTVRPNLEVNPRLR